MEAAVDRIEADAKDSGKTYFMLAKKNGVVGFYKLAADAAIKAHKAYLKFDGASNIKGYIFSFDEEEEEDPTAIQQMETDAEATIVGIYSLSGARQNSLQRGMNIIRMSDGSVKKVLVK